MDIDFSKAYDSTEHFEKEISMRRMGMPEEGIQLWKQYDSSRKMHILTAHGLTKDITPECGCWGQGAEEAPYGWLAFMCWMSRVIDEEAKVHGYVTGGEGTHRTRLHKIIYADDGTYFAKTREGMQYTATAIDKFCAATGILVKPEKSYVYANHEGQAIKINTYKGNTGYKLVVEKKVYIKEITQQDYWKHLGECTE